MLFLKFLAQTIEYRAYSPQAVGEFQDGYSPPLSPIHRPRQSSSLIDDLNTSLESTSSRHSLSSRLSYDSLLMTARMKVASLNSIIEAYCENVEALNHRLVQTETSRQFDQDGFRKTLETVKLQNSSLERQNEKQRRIIQGMLDQSSVSSSSVPVQRLQEQVTSLQERVRELESQVTRKDDEIQVLSDKLVKKDRTVEKYKKAHLEGREVFLKLKGDFEKLNQDFEALQEASHDPKAKIEALEARITELDHEKATLQRERVVLIEANNSLNFGRQEAASRPPGYHQGALSTVTAPRVGVPTNEDVPRDPPPVYSPAAPAKPPSGISRIWRK